MKRAAILLAFGCVVALATACGGTKVIEVTPKVTDSTTPVPATPSPTADLKQYFENRVTVGCGKSGTSDLQCRCIILDLEQKYSIASLVDFLKQIDSHGDTSSNPIVIKLAFGC
jgi:hypothetical protein